MELIALAEAQHGAFSREQARGIGMTDRRLDRLVANGVVELVLPAVFRFRGTRPNWHHRLMAAVLSTPDALASHRAAARLWGLRGFEQSPVEIVVERWARRGRRPDGIIIHETKDLVAGDIDERDGIACCALVRTLVDLPAVVPSPKAGDALDHAARYDPTLLKRVAARHREVARRGRNGTVKLRSLLAERNESVVDSGFERHALTLIRSSGLPKPVTQHKVTGLGFTYYLDLAWPGQMVAMECDSIEHHYSISAFQWDRERRRRLNRLGWRVLEFTYADVTKRGPMVLQELGFHLVT